MPYIVLKKKSILVVVVLGIISNKEGFYNWYNKVSILYVGEIILKLCILKYINKLLFLSK